MLSELKNSIKWSMLELRGLVEDEDARVYYQRAKRHLGLHPFHLNDLNTSIREILSSKVNFYDKELQGLLLVYKNPKLISPLGAILHDSHFVHVDVLADFYVFKPEIGCTLKGIINKKAENHVGVLVHKAFNVSIPKPEESEEWLGDSVYVGQEVKFTVTHLDFKGKLPFIRGTLLADGIDIGNHDDPIGSTYGEEVDTKLGQWQDTATNELAPESPRKRSKKRSTVVDSSGDDLSDSDNKLAVFRRNEEKSTKVKTPKNPTTPRIDDESSTDETDEHVSNSVSTKERHASSNKRNQKKERDSSPKNIDIEEKSSISPRKRRRNSSSSETIDIDEKPKINPRKASKEKRANSESDATEEGTVLRTESRGRSKKRSNCESDATEEETVLKTESRSRSKKRSNCESDATEEETVLKTESQRPSKKRSNGETDATEEETVLKTESQRSSKKRSNGDSDATEEETVLKTEPQCSSKKRSDKNKNSTARLEKETLSDERKAGLIESLKVEKSSKDKINELTSKTKMSNTGSQHDKSVDSAEAPDGRVVSPKKQAKKNKIPDYETEEASEVETKPSVRVKKKKKTKVKYDEDAVEEPATLPSNDRDFEFVKPDIDACMNSSAKSKRKRRKDVDDDGEAASDPSQPDAASSEQNESEFFRDIRIKVEPDPSDVEDTVSVKSGVKRKKKRAKIEMDSGDESFGATTIKTEPDASDIEDARPSKKKSKKRRSGDEDSLNSVKIKVEPNASDVEGSVVPKSRWKSEPHDYKINVDRENGRV